MKSYGTLKFRDLSGEGLKSKWLIVAAPHVMIRLKNVFPKIDKSQIGLAELVHNLEVCRDLEWFLERYPLEMDSLSAGELARGSEAYLKLQADLEAICLPGATFREFKLAKPLRHYQERSLEIYLKLGSLLVGDQLGLGKTVTAIGSFTQPEALPALVVCQTHLVRQWKRMLAEFMPSATAHVIEFGTPYNLPTAQVYIVTYSKLAGWAEVLHLFIKSIVFDEVQEVRHTGTKKYRAALAIRNACTYAMGLSATPIYNYGGEIFNVMEVISPGRLGSWAEFCREWCDSRGDKAVLKNPEAFGEYMRDNFFIVRNTREEVGLELPPLEKIVQTIPYSPEALEEIRDTATELAHLILSGSFFESGSAAREFDARLRQATGIAKAAYVAEYVKMLIEDDEGNGFKKVLLFGWHRAVYEVWMERLKGYNPQLYTGTESPAQKDRALKVFDNQWGSQVLIMSLRSGSGVDGIQVNCNTCVFGELDWSPGVHEQCIGRLNRDGTKAGVNAFFLLADGGSDPAVAEVLGLKSEQVRGIVDPSRREKSITAQSDMARVKKMAEAYLERHKHERDGLAEIRDAGFEMRDETPRLALESLS